MKKLRNLFSRTTVCVLAYLIASQAVADYDYHSFDYPGAAYVQVFSLNNQLQVVGTASVGADLYPFVYDSKTGTFLDLATIGGYDFLSVFDINEAGQIVGYVTNDSPSSEAGLLLNRDGNASLFEHPNAASIIWARGLNNSGLIAGTRDSVDNQGTFLEGVPTNGFIYNTKAETFVDTVASALTIAQGIDSAGNVVGSAIFVPPLDNPCPSLGFTYAWLWEGDGTTTYFGIDSFSTRARGIRNNGEIAGWYVDPVLGARGFVAQLDDSQCQSINPDDIELIHFPGATQTFVQGINHAGVVSGYYEDATGGHGFFAKPK